MTSRDLCVQLSDLDNDSSVSRAQYYYWRTKHSDHPCDTTSQRVVKRFPCEEIHILIFKNIITLASYFISESFFRQTR